jgi:zinc protease
MTIAPRFARTLLPAALLLAAIPAVPAFAVDPSLYDPTKLTTPAIGKIPAVKPERFTLPNGVVVYLLENHDLPVVRGIAYFPCSPTLTPADRAGLPGLAGEVIRTGGTAAHTGDWLDDRLAAIGASVNASVAPTLANTGFRCLTENTAEVVSLWAEVTRQPAFPDDKIELSKAGLRRSIASRNDEMMGILFRAATQAVYGKDSPWSRQPEYATVEPIAKADCQKLHAEVFVPERMTVAIYGDFKAAEMKALLTAKLADWKKSGTPAPVLPPTPTSVTTRLVYAPKEDVTQSGILLAQPGSRCDDPDYASLTVLEQALGGGFASRMFSHIRTQRGLAYATGAQAGADYQRPGVFLAYSLTQSESTLTALDLVKDEVRKITEAPLTASELEIAKQSVANSYVFNFADPSQTLFRAAYFQAVGYPADFLQTYQKSLDAVTGQSVLEAARRKITPAAQVVVIVGKEKDFERPLASTGIPVERMDITIPPPPSKLGKVSVSPASKQQGSKWLADAATAAGGSKAWAAVKSVTEATDATLSMQGQSISISGTESWRFPDHKLSVQKLPFGEITQGVDGATGWMSAMGQLQDNPKAGEENAKDWEKSLWRIFSDPASVDLSALEAPEVVDGVSYRAAVMTGAKTQDLAMLFTADGKFAGFAYQDEGSGQMGPARVVQLYSGWSAEGALQYPHVVKLLRDGKPFVEGKVTSLTINPVLADAIFKKPAK